MSKAVKVKINALVDKEIAPLVLALNVVSCVWTLSSSQGGYGGPAYVYFRYLGIREDEPVFFACLGQAMAERNSQKECTYNLTLIWRSVERAIGKLECHPGDILHVSSIVRSALTSEHMTKFLSCKALTN